MAVAEGMMPRSFKDILGLELQPPFARLPYLEAVGRYGLDKPDTRFGLELKDVSEIVGRSGFKCSPRPSGRAASSRP